MTAVPPLSEDDLHDLYLWVDEIPLSKPKRNIARDFADGVCIAEVVKYHFPKHVELHNYTPASSMTQKLDNWSTLNQKVFRKLYFEVPAEEVRDIASAVPGAVERFLRALRIKINQIQVKQGGSEYRNAAADRKQHSAYVAPTHNHHAFAAPDMGHQVAVEKEQTIGELRETVTLLNEKVAKLEELLRVKDAKISALQRR